MFVSVCIKRFSKNAKNEKRHQRSCNDKVSNRVSTHLRMVGVTRVPPGTHVVGAYVTQKFDE
jgi:hypothetical protein